MAFRNGRWIIKSPIRENEKVTVTLSEDSASVPIPPPLIFFALLAAGGILEYLFPSAPAHLPLLAFRIAGTILLIISGVIAAASFVMLIRCKTPFDPAKPTTVIICNGPFRFTRNPLYLSLALLLAGIAAFLCSAWLFLALVLLIVILDVFAIRREEAYLTRKFGSEYLAYKASVRRWI
jgi:protein-S-isoprenylcysteine O-methyltransferase Ste14